MSGVIDDDGVQWERCNGCGEFTRLDTLRSEPPSTEHRYGRDLCPKCAPHLKPNTQHFYMRKPC